MDDDAHLHPRATSRLRAALNRLVGRLRRHPTAPKVDEADVWI